MPDKDDPAGKVCARGVCYHRRKLHKVIGKIDMKTGGAIIQDVLGEDVQYFNCSTSPSCEAVTILSRKRHFRLVWGQCLLVFASLRLDFLGWSLLLVFFSVCLAEEK